MGIYPLSNRSHRLASRAVMLAKPNYRKRSAQFLQKQAELELAELDERAPRPRAELECQPDWNADRKFAVHVGEGVKRFFDLRLQHRRECGDLHWDRSRVRKREFLAQLLSLQDLLVEHWDDNHAAQASLEIRVRVDGDGVGVGSK